MNHVGNDVVDLKASGAIAKSRDTRFVKRALSTIEMQTVLTSDQPDSLLWAFWAAKETSYKVVSKSYPDITSAPRRYSVKLVSERIENEASGVVDTPCGSVPVKWTFSEDYIHCIGADAGGHSLDKINFGLKEIDTSGESGACLSHRTESILVRRHATHHIASLLHRNPDDIHIGRTNGKTCKGPPVVHIKDNRDHIDISLSHDGRFLAYAFLLGR